MNTKQLLIFFIFFVIVSQAAHSQIIDNGLEKIKSTDLMHTVKVLSSAEYDGRLPGSEGYNKAADFASETFERLGLIPMGTDGFFQHLKVEYNKIDTPAVLQIFMENKKSSYLHGSDFVLRGSQALLMILYPLHFADTGFQDQILVMMITEKLMLREKLLSSSNQIHRGR